MDGIEKKAVCIAAITDDGFAQHLGVTLCSMIKNHAQGDFLRIFIVDVGIGVGNKKKLMSLVEPSSMEMSFLDIDKNLYVSFPLTQPQSATTYYKLSIAELLPADVEKIIYLDSDLVILDDIQKLWSVDIGSYALAAVKDHRQDRLEVLGIPPAEGYFNAGVLVINAEIWRREKLGEKIRNYIHNHCRQISFRWGDQDPMNLVLHGRWLELDQRWNRPSYKCVVGESHPVSAPAWSREWNGIPAIIHFLSEYKPWQYANQDPVKDLYFRYLASTPWSDFKFKDKSLMNIFIKFLFKYCPSPFLAVLQDVYRKAKNTWRENLWNAASQSDSFFKNILLIGVVSLIASLSDLLLSMILGRSLSEDIFGRVNFIFSLIVFGGSVFIYGRQIVLIRALSGSGGTEYNWRRFIRQTIKFSSLATAVFVFLASWIYDLWQVGFCIFAGIILLILTEMISSFLRAKQKFLSSIIIFKISSFFVLILSFVYFMVCHFKSLSMFFLFYSFCLGLPVCVGLRTVGRYVNGKKDISVFFKDSGRFIFFIGLLFFFMTFVDRFLIVKILGYPQFGGYVAISSIIKIYDFITAAFCYLLIPVYSQGKRLDFIKQDFVFFFLLAALFSLIILAIGPILIDAMYHGKYDSWLYLLKYFVAVGTLKILFIIPASLINGHISMKGLRQSMNFMIMGLISYIVLSYIFISHLGLLGALMGSMFIWAYLVISGYWLSFKQIKIPPLHKQVK